MLEKINEKRAHGLTWRQVAASLGISVDELVKVRAQAEALAAERAHDARLEAELLRYSGGFIPSR